MKKYHGVVLLSVFLSCFELQAQRKEDPDSRLLTAGFQFRPLFPNKFFGAGEVSASDRHLSSYIKPKLGYTFGMVIRRGFAPKISLETGINYFRRNYTMRNDNDSLRTSDVSDFGVVSYEIPVQALFYIRLSEKIYMNTSFGLSLNWFASDVYSKGNDQHYTQYTEISKGWLKASLLANIGWEYRTEKSGFFYLGGSLHRPLFPIGNSTIHYDNGPIKYKVEMELTGTIMTLDLRYFFHAKPVKKGQEKKKKN